MAKRQLDAGFGAPNSKRRNTTRKGGSPIGALSSATEPDTAMGNRESCAAPRWSRARYTGPKGAGTLVSTNSLTSTEDHVHASHNVFEGTDDGAPIAEIAGVGSADCGIQASAKPENDGKVSSSNEVDGSLVIEEQRVVKSQRQTKPRSVRGRGAGRASSGTGRRGSAAAASTAKKQGARLSPFVRGRAREKRPASGRGIQASAKPDDPDQVSTSNGLEGRCVVEEQGAVKRERQTKPRSVRGRGSGRPSQGTGKRGSAAAAATRKKQCALPSTSVRGGVRGNRPANDRGRGRGKAAAKLRTCQGDQQDDEEGDAVSAAGGHQPSKDKEAPAGTETEKCEEGRKAKPTRRNSRRAGEPKREPGGIDVIVEDQGPAKHSNARAGKKRRAQAVVPTTGYEVREAFDSFLEDLEATCKQRGVTMTADELQRLALHRWSSMSIKRKAHCVARMKDQYSLGLQLSIRPWRMTLRDQPTPADFVRQSKELYNWGRVRLK